MRPLNLQKDEAMFIIEALEFYENHVMKRLNDNDYEDEKMKWKLERDVTCASRMIAKAEYAMKQITTASAKAKGRELQYWVCDRIGELFDIQFIQSDDTCPIHSREMGLNGSDVILRGEIARQFPFTIECKAQENIHLAEWIAQAIKNNKNHWMLVVKKHGMNKSKPVVIIDWESFARTFKGTIAEYYDKKKK